MPCNKYIPKEYRPIFVNILQSKGMFILLIFTHIVNISKTNIDVSIR